MGGGLLQLVAMGAQDAYLSGNPQITFWKGMFKRHTNFAMEQFRINLTGMPMWGQKQSATIGRHADLIYSTYLEVSLPVGLYNNDQRRLGYNLLRYVELEVGGQLIDRLYGEWLFLWDSLTSDVTKGLKLHGMVAAGITERAASITIPASCNPTTGRPSKPTTLYIPLSFFYTRNAGTALPMIALQYHEVKINILWNSPQLVAGDFTQLQFAPNPSSAAIYVDYIYLDVEERRRMAQESHEYLIEQVQYNEDKGITSASQRVDLTFNHPVKELVWVVQPSNYTNCKLPASTAVFGEGRTAGTPYSVTASALSLALTDTRGPTGNFVNSTDYFYRYTPTYTVNSVYGLTVGGKYKFANTTNAAIALGTAITAANFLWISGGGHADAAAGLRTSTSLFNGGTLGTAITSINYSTNQITTETIVYKYTTPNSGTETFANGTATFASLVSTGAVTISTRDTDRLTPFTYDVDAVYSQHLQFNGQDRLDKRFGDYYNEVQPFQHHTGSTSSVYRDANGSAISTAQPGVYCYSFALKPEEQQPSGTCNFSRIDTATIVMSIDGKVPIDRDQNEYDVRVYATNYNILRIMSGMAGLAYSN
jgi:hypothetical protein